MIRFVDDLLGVRVPLSHSWNAIRGSTHCRADPRSGTFFYLSIPLRLGLIVFLHEFVQRYQRSIVIPVDTIAVGVHLVLGRPAKRRNTLANIGDSKGEYYGVILLSIDLLHSEVLCCRSSLPNLMAFPEAIAHW